MGFARNTLEKPGGFSDRIPATVLPTGRHVAALVDVHIVTRMNRLEAKRTSSNQFLQARVDVHPFDVRCHFSHGCVFVDNAAILEQTSLHQIAKTVSSFVQGPEAVRGAVLPTCIGR